MPAHRIANRKFQLHHEPHPVHVVHRVSAVVLGLGLWLFGGLGLARGLQFVVPNGQQVLGLSTDGLLSVISLVAGAVLLATAAWRGPAASTAIAAIGTVFLLSGLVHLAILDTAWNILAFRLSNVGFSLAVGLVFLVLGLYGRLAGRLPADNPYRRARADRRGIPTQREPRQESRAEAEYLAAEIAMSEGHASPRQAALVQGELRERARQYRLQAQERANRAGKRVG
jgi:hypothetical protein